MQSRNQKNYLDENTARECIENVKPIQSSLVVVLLPILPLIKQKLAEGTSKRAMARILGVHISHFCWALNKAEKLASKTRIQGSSAESSRLPLPIRGKEEIIRRNKEDRDKRYAEF